MAVLAVTDQDPRIWVVLMSEIIPEHIERVFPHLDDDDVYDDEDDE